MFTEELSTSDETAIEAVSTIEALDDIADAVEMIVLSFASEQERGAYLALADEYGSHAEKLLEEPGKKDLEQDSRLQELQEQMENSFKAMLQSAPEHIRALHDAARGAIEAEETADE